MAPFSPHRGGGGGGGGGGFAGVMIFIMLVIVENHESIAVVVNTNDGTSNRKMPWPPVHSVSYTLAMCGKSNGCCYVYDVQHLEYHTGCNCLKPSVAFLTGCPTWCP